ncbi:hypothetical protein GGQ80_001141 [Sphingomonas jinjuensis]|uniref:Uncharacterized protein n=1 Tax=Sphingomonas jinjuensis TaxID=535907 RepID=A0A840F1N3_9SPHN|nr:hypothetical protein [Sphingomonas jinjuensis]MBB4153253.1 hypothetical protein [Sphingomonas jinjuensis]
MSEQYKTYPDLPGYKGEAETGREAAAAIAPRMGRLQRMVHQMVTERGAQGLTPEEACDMSGETRVSLQPRFSELKAKGVIVDSGMRRSNPSSWKRAVVWVLPCYRPEPAGGEA